VIANGFKLTGVFLCWLLGGACLAGEAPIKLGIAKTFLNGQSTAVIDIAVDDFQKVLKNTTGLTGKVTSKLGPFEVAEKLDAKVLDFGIFHAHEFAWVRKKHPDLLPLLICADKYYIERAFIIVARDSPYETLADLRGKKFDLAIGAKEHCRIYLNKVCTEKNAKGPAAFFGSIVKSKDPLEALDNLARRKTDATVVDLNRLEFYKEVKGPVFRKNLRVLQESGDFPPALIAYRKGKLDQETLDQFRDGLLKAHTVADGRDLMKQWNIDNFAAVGKDYAKSLADILKAYPAPE
jgi:ABC-type phosphate/phosphonate transport system substrate-binding protein